MLKARNTIRDRGPLYPLVGLLTAAVFLLITRISVGAWPNPVFIVSLLLIGMGVGLVVARIGRLGPLEGLLGSPWFEAKLLRTLARERARSNRFARDLSIVIARQQAGRRIEWQSHIRLCDELIPCRDGWQCLILPETTEAGAFNLLHRLNVISGVDLQAVVLASDGDLHEPGDLGKKLAGRIRTPMTVPYRTLTTNGVAAPQPLLTARR